jgi:hypothetical protein
MGPVGWPRTVEEDLIKGIRRCRNHTKVFLRDMRRSKQTSKQAVPNQSKDFEISSSTKARANKS